MAFAAGQKVTAAQINSACPIGATQSTMSAVSGTVTVGTPYVGSLTGGAPTHTLAFTAPASGSIWVSITASATNNSTGYGCISFAISGAAGTRAASDDYQAFMQGVTTPRPEQTLYRRVMITGLTPGAAGTITMYYRSFTAGTTTFNYRQIGYEPVAA